jgi:lipoprotein NlpI
MAYNNRGNVWLDKKEYDKAIADYGEAVRLDPKDAAAYNNRGSARRAKSEYDNAIADYGEAIRLDPRYAMAYFNRSATQMILRRDGAVSGFKTVLDLEGVKGNLSTYAVILGQIAARLAKDDTKRMSFLEDAATKLDVNSWPYPVVKLLRGEIDEPALLAAAIDDNKRTDARCYLGLDQLIKGKTDQAASHFRWVREHGNPTFVEYGIAQAELDRLEKADPKGPAAGQ